MATLNSLVLSELIDVSRTIQDPEVRESLQSALVSAQEDRGWKLLSGFDRDNGPDIGDAVRLSQAARIYLAGNPMSKRGVRLRVGYIWGGGVDFGKSRGTKQIVDKNTDRFFSIDAYEEYEQALATDGNVFTLLDPGTKKMQNIPLAQISGWVCTPDDSTEIMYWKRTWVEVTTTPDGERTTKDRTVYYPDVSNEDRTRKRIGQFEVDVTKRLHHAHVNRQAGWVLGLPDLFVATLWVAAYKEFLEGGQMVNQALTRFAYKAVSTTKAGSQRAAAALAVQPDPTAPQPVNGYSPYGATANATGMDLVAMSKTGAMIDFDAARALAALVAAGLEVPLTALLADSAGSGGASAEDSLDNATVDAMRIRQQKADASYTKRMKYLGVPNPQVTFPPVRSVPVHRMIQAITIGAATGTLSPKSVHKVLSTQLAEYGYIDDGVLPEPGEWAEYVKGGGADPNHPGTPPLNTPNGDNTNTDGRGPADDVGDNGNDVRNDS